MLCRNINYLQIFSYAALFQAIGSRSPPRVLDTMQTNRAIYALSERNVLVTLRNLISLKDTQLR